MTPAQVWANAYTDEYQGTLEWLRANGYEDADTLPTGATVRAYCRTQALAFADETRSMWVEANPQWLEWVK